MEKPIIFISHITEEKELAFLLKDYIEKSFLGYVQVFVSSHGDSILSGDRWLNKVDEALKSCIIELVLCSPSSVTRPWIQFETGAAWGRNIPIIPLCHSGATPDTNPVPLSELQGVVISQESGIIKMMDSIAKRLELRSPQDDTKELLAGILRFEEDYTFGDSVVRFLDSVGGSRRALQEFKSLDPLPDSINMGLGEISSADFSTMKSFLTPRLKEYFSFSSKNPSLNFCSDGAISKINVCLHVSHLHRIVDLLDKKLK